MRIRTDTAGIAAVLLASIALSLPAFAQVDDTAKKPWQTDPYTKGDSELMERLGYLQYGPFPWDGAERTPDPHLPMPTHTTGQKQMRDVEAGDEEQQRHGHEPIARQYEYEQERHEQEVHRIDIVPPEKQQRASQQRESGKSRGTAGLHRPSQ